MSDEAREAAWARFVASSDAFAYRQFNAAHAAGVAEGIRQAREAVAGGGPWLVYDDRRVALSAIDALGEENGQ